MIGCQADKNGAYGGMAMEAKYILSLLTSIAQKRDHEAFAELYERYEKSAFNIAFRILRNSMLAQDAVQEAMLSIWCSPASALPKGDIEDWIMRIVMNKSMNLRRGQRRSENRECRKAMEQNRSGVALMEEIEGIELIAVLRRHIDQLPELECTLLACCYGANMPHREIAKLVDIPHQTVSYKIQQALDRLRLDLTKAGVAAVVPLLSTGNLFEAMTTGRECPPGMTEKMMQRIASHENAARSLSRRVAVGSARSAWALSTFAVVAVAGVLIVAWFAKAERSVVNHQLPAKSLEPTGREPLKNSGIGTGKGAAPEVNYHWTFEKGSPAEIAVRGGGWKWNDQARLMETACGVNLQLPGPLPHRTMMIQLKTKGGHKANWGAAFGAVWSDGVKLLKFRLWQVDPGADPLICQSGKKYVWKVFVKDSYSVGYLNDELRYISEYEPNVAEADYLVLLVKNLDAEDLVLKEVKESDLPAEVRENPSALSAKLGWSARYIGDQALPPHDTPDR
jgi:RNA polymerase sigma-70 factor (ECF subfamily)